MISSDSHTISLYIDDFIITVITIHHYYYCYYYYYIAIITIYYCYTLYSNKAPYKRCALPE